MPATRRRKRGEAAPKLDFPITQEHIDTAVPKDSSHCMIADALKDAMPNAEYVSVDLATIRFTDRMAGRRYIYLTPRTAQQALLDFDQGEKPKPFRINDVRAAQIVPTGTARKRTRAQDPDAPKRVNAKLVTGSGNNAQNVPVKVGGQAPPLGPMAGGDLNGKAAEKAKTSVRRREFGLKGFIR